MLKHFTEGKDKQTKTG